MSSDLRDLYQEVILDHSKKPRNFHAMAAPDRKAEGYNPLCGDRETVFLALDGEVLKAASFHELITGKPGGGNGGPELGKLEVFSGVREYPVRVKCATLPWHTLKAALDGAGAPVSTESEGPAAESGGA